MLLFHKYCFFMIDIFMENPSHHLNNSSSSSSSEDEDTKLEVTRIFFKKKIGCIISSIIK